MYLLQGWSGECAPSFLSVECVFDSNHGMLKDNKRKEFGLIPLSL